MRQVIWKIHLFECEFLRLRSLVKNDQLNNVKTLLKQLTSPLISTEVIRSFNWCQLTRSVQNMTVYVAFRHCFTGRFYWEEERGQFQTFWILYRVILQSSFFFVSIVVVQMLDKLKCSSGKVRDMIRWMEAQLKNGDRFLQAQLSHQQESIPCIKYPKKKDKEAW